MASAATYAFGSSSAAATHPFLVGRRVERIAAAAAASAFYRQQQLPENAYRLYIIHIDNVLCVNVYVYLLCINEKRLTCAFKKMLLKPDFVEKLTITTTISGILGQT